MNVFDLPWILNIDWFEKTVPTGDAEPKYRYEWRITMNIFFHLEREMVELDSVVQDQRHN